MSQRTTRQDGSSWRNRVGSPLELLVTQAVGTPSDGATAVDAFTARKNGRVPWKDGRTTLDTILFIGTQHIIPWVTITSSLLLHNTIPFSCCEGILKTW
jgi:hypothetical protein